MVPFKGKGGKAYPGPVANRDGIVSLSWPKRKKVNTLEKKWGVQSQKHSSLSRRLRKIAGGGISVYEKR